MMMAYKLLTNPTVPSWIKQMRIGIEDSQNDMGNGEQQSVWLATI
jgi:hypothetical protein